MPVETSFLESRKFVLGQSISLLNWFDYDCHRVYFPPEPKKGGEKGEHYENERKKINLGSKSSSAK